MKADCMRFQATWQSVAVLADPGLRIKHRRRSLALAVAWALGGTLAVAFNPAAVAQPFPATLPLSSLDGSNGFKLEGEAERDYAGQSVSAAGDVNDDGIDDLIVGASNADPNGNNSGRAYVVFGTRDGFAGTFPLSGLDGTNGFKLDGEAPRDYAGVSVSAAGDVNGDGNDDLIIGASQSNSSGNYGGRSYVVFGGINGYTATFQLSSLDGTNGFSLDGEAEDDRSGRSVSAVGDVNGDGIDDLIIGAYRASPNGTESGRSYVVFGRTTGFAANFPLSNIDGTNGFRLDGEAANHASGFSASAAGDVNGDGIDDLIVGAKGPGLAGNSPGRSYVVFGTSDGFAASLALSSLDGKNGFKLEGAAGVDYFGHSVSAAGDVNGDGIDDLIVGAPSVGIPSFGFSGDSYVVFGTSEGFAANLAMSSLDGTNGFKLEGEAVGDLSGVSVSAAGDVNGDRIDDLIVGAHFADTSAKNSGRGYVVFGSSEGFPATLPLSSLNGTNGFKLDGEVAYDLSGVSVSGAGDLNGDGVDDLVIGAFGADPGGFQSGRSYVVFGRDTTFADGYE